MGHALNWDTDGRDWPNRGASSFVHAAGLRWHMQRMGHGPVMLLLHGSGSSSHSWRDLLPKLARDFSCVAIDLPGHAFTAMPPARLLSLQGMAHAVARLLGELRLTPSMIVGHSAGAAIAAQLCCAEGMTPRSIVSVNGAFFPLSGFPGLVFPPIARMMDATRLAPRLLAWHASDRRIVHRMIERTGSKLDERGEQLYGLLARTPPHVAAVLGMMARWQVESVVCALPTLRTRLHLIAGARDFVVPPQQSSRVQLRALHADLTMIKDAGHLVHEEKPAEVAELIAGWNRAA
ncbi:alpha/beta fold hydrolase BchO [Variovorax sp. GT1P44]|uniref:alpha/beta fold hydrolase BchO n=1 Tax=Variovorax sp. GT1P44 TaxID=3443742 RepID=UPI003F46DC48